MRDFTFSEWKVITVSFLFLHLFIFKANAQNRTITGKVVDAKTNESVIGASVQIKGTATGTATDVNGAFRLNVPTGATLEVKSIGYTTLDVAPNFTNAMVVKIVPTNSQLNEVVVVGYGSQKKETLTGSIATVSAKSFQDKGPIDNPLQALQGQVPGVIITRSSAAPGNEGWSMQLRGASSVSGSDPLVVIDGVAVPGVGALNSLNPADIESMSFLKDASAAIYGARAAGGVVLVTTKKGKLGKTVVQYDGSYSRKILGLQPQLMNIQQYATGLLEARTNDGYGATDQWILLAKLMLANNNNTYIDNTTYPGGNPIPGFGDVKDYPFFNNTWTKVLWGNANSTTHNLSVSGRTEKAGYRLSLGYLDDGSLLKWGDNFNQRYNIRLANDFSISNKLKIESNISLEKQNVVTPTLISSVLGEYQQPGFPVSTINGLPYAWGGQLSPNWQAQLGGDNRVNNTRLYINEKLDYDIVKHLRFVGTVAYNPNTIDQTIQQNSIQFYNYTGTIAGTLSPGQADTYYQRGTTNDAYYNANAYLEYKNTFKANHDIGLTVGSQYERDEYDYFYAKTNNLASATVPALGLGIGDLTTKTDGETKNHYAIGSYFGRFNYAFKSKYLLEANARYDGSSKFDPTNRWKLFYGFSGGWRVTQESFMKNFKFIDDLKLRASYGVVGNQNGIGLYDYLQLLNVGYSTSVTSNYPILGTSPVVTVAPTSTLVSLNRTWEQLETTNLAVDFAVLKSKLTGTVEIFEKNNKNMLLARTYSAVLGATAPASNSGYLRTKGIESVLNWADRIGKVNYHFGGTITYNKNKLINFGGQQVITQGLSTGTSANPYVQGYPIGSVFGLQYAGRIQTQAQLTDYLTKYLAGNTIGIVSTLRVGDNMFKDVNGDGKITNADFTYLGTDDPRLSYSFNAGLEWKGFDFSIVFQGVGQRTIFRSGNWEKPYAAVYLGQSTQSSGNTWNESNTDAFYPKLSSTGTYNNYNYQASSWSVQNGAYLRLKNLVVGYTLPQKLMERTKFISRARFYFSGNDLWENTKIRDGWDPEAPTTVSTYGRYPFYRFVTTGVNLTF